MGHFSQMFESRATSQPSGHPRDPALADLFGSGSTSIAGPRITEDTALSIGVVWACIQIISETLAALPFLPYKRLPKGREVANDHPLYKVLHIKPNPFMTPMDFHQTIQGHVLAWGNGFAEIVRNGSGAVEQLWPLLPQNMRLQVFNDKLFYYVRGNAGAERQLRQDQVFHLRGLGNDGLIGYSVISKHRETLGLTKGQEEYAERFFANDGRPGGVLEHPAKLSELAYNRLKESWAEAHSGLHNAHKPAILEENMKWRDVGVPPKDAEFILGRKFQIQEVARIFRVPLILLQEHEGSTSWGTGIEQIMIAFVVHTLTPWATRWEQQGNITLFTEREQQRFYLKHTMDALLRGDFKSRQEGLAVMRQNGIINSDEWRELIDWNPQADGHGDVYWRPANMMPADAPVEEPAPAPSV